MAYSVLLDGKWSEKMVRLLQKDRLKFYIIFIIASAFCVIFLTGKKAPDNDMISCLTSANFICLILNNLYIYYIYTRALKIKSIYYMFKHKFYKLELIACE